MLCRFLTPPVGRVLLPDAASAGASRMASSQPWVLSTSAAALGPPLAAETELPPGLHTGRGCAVAHPQHDLLHSGAGLTSLSPRAVHVLHRGRDTSPSTGCLPAAAGLAGWAAGPLVVGPAAACTVACLRMQPGPRGRTARGMVGGRKGCFAAKAAPPAAYGGSVGSGLRHPRV